MLVCWMVSNVENICITVFSVNTVLENTDNSLMLFLKEESHSTHPNRTPVSDKEPRQRDVGEVGVRA